MSELEKYDKNMKGVAISNDIMNFYNPMDNDIFSIEGLAFYKENHNYHRLLNGCEEKVTDAVNWLQKMPTGGQIRFKTNSKIIALKIKNYPCAPMCHMPATGQQGADLYYKRACDKEYIFYTVTKFACPTTEFECEVFRADNKEDKDIIINLPLYQGLESILIGIEKDAYLEKVTPHANDGKIIIYGTSVTQGGCASRPGMLFTNILSRKMDYEFINLGFSGSGMGEPVMAHYMKDIDNPKMFILDYEANGACTSSLEDHIEELIDILREKHPLTPIVVMSKVTFAVDLFDKKNYDRRKYYLKFQRNVVNKRKKAKDENIYFIDGSKLFGKEDIYEMQVDGLHPTDLGFYMMAKNLKPRLERILKK